MARSRVGRIHSCSITRDSVQGGGALVVLADSPGDAVAVVAEFTLTPFTGAQGRILTLVRRVAADGPPLMSSVETHRMRSTACCDFELNLQC